MLMRKKEGQVMERMKMKVGILMRRLLIFRKKWMRRSWLLEELGKRRIYRKGSRRGLKRMTCGLGILRWRPIMLLLERLNLPCR
jgi:hypothetical protein